MPTAVIIAGGEGTRLRPLTFVMPKPLAPMLGRPFLDYQLALIKAANIRRTVFNLHYMPDAIIKRYKTGVDWAMEFHYSIEEDPRGTAGAVKMGEEYFGDDELVVFNGDVLTDVDLTGIIELHRSKGARVTITLTRVKDPTAYGLVFTDKDGRVERFLEKPKPEEATVDTINAGIYIINRDVIDEIPKDTFYMFEKGLYPMMLDRGDPVYAYIHEGYWLDIGTPGKYLKGCSDLINGNANNPFPLEQIGSTGVYGHPEVKVDPLADLTGPCFIDKGSAIGSRRIGPNAFLGRKVTVGNDAKIVNSIILNGCNIGDGAVINGAMICANCRIGDNVLLPNGTLLGGYTRIPGIT